MYKPQELGMYTGIKYGRKIVCIRALKLFQYFFRNIVLICQRHVFKMYLILF